MNDGLIDAFGHNAWATREVLRVCEGLTPAQLRATAPGTYGSIIATLWHTVTSDAGYCARLTGEERWLTPRAEGPASVHELAGHVDDLAARWDRFLARPFDAERTFVIRWHDDADRDVPAGVVLAQAIHHGNEHRAHVCTVLTTLGVSAPALGLWDYAEATNRARHRGA